MPKLAKLEWENSGCESAAGEVLVFKSVLFEGFSPSEYTESVIRDLNNAVHLLFDHSHIVYVINVEEWFDSEVLPAFFQIAFEIALRNIGYVIKHYRIFLNQADRVVLLEIKKLVTHISDRKGRKNKKSNYRASLYIPIVLVRPYSKVETIREP